MNPPFGDHLAVSGRKTRPGGPFTRIFHWLDEKTPFRHRISIRGRIALFGAAVVASTVVIFSVLVYVVVERSLVSQQDITLKRQGDSLWRQIESGRPIRLGGEPSFFQRSVDINASSAPFVEIMPLNGQPVSTGTVNDGTPTFAVSVWQSVPFDPGVWKDVRPLNGPPVRAYIRAWRTPAATGYVLVGQSIYGIETQLAGLRLLLVAGGLLSLIGAAAASWLVAGRALRPLDMMADTAEDIGRTQDLSRRLPDSGPDDEVGRLQRSFNQMLRQLQDAYGRLQSALVAQRRFVADASHELRTPLTTIRGNVGLLLKRDDISPDDRIAALNDIAGESERMSRMVQDLLTLARADAGYHLDKSLIDLEPVVQEVLRQAQTLQPTRHVALLNGVPALMQGNVDAIKQLLWILIDNAVKHTTDGGHIDLTLQRAGGWAALTVRDDGPGIPQEDLERIFERFYQADSSRTGEGTGLGLAIARWIAQEHGGRVSAGNNAGGGAAFTVQLPVQNS